MQAAELEALVADLAKPLQANLQLVESDGLDDVVDRPLRHGGHGGVDASVLGQNDQIGGGSNVAHLLDGRERFRSRSLKVEKDHVERAASGASRVSAVAFVAWTT